MNKNFGFSSELLDKNHNDGKKHLYITLDFAEKIFEDSTTNIFHLKEKFHATYMHKGSKMKYRCEFYFRKITFGENKQQMFYTIGNSGSYGFHGGQFTKRETLSPYVVKQCLEQLYDFLETLEKI